MIELSTNTAMMLYLVLTLGFVLGIWIYNQYFSKRKKISIAARELLVCEYCHCAYLEELGKPVTQCPQCHSYNKSNKYRSLE